MNIVVLSIFVTILCPLSHCQQDDADNSLLLEPQFDSINMTKYLSNDLLLKFQLKCILFNGPCDAVGHWIKPRVKAALLGECLKCTKVQSKYMQTWMTILMDYFPEIHRAAVAKYIHDEGIGISEEDQQLIQKINSEAGWAEFKTRLQTAMQDLRDGKIS